MEGAYYIQKQQTSNDIRLISSAIENIRWINEGVTCNAREARVLLIKSQRWFNDNVKIILIIFARVQMLLSLSHKVLNDKRINVHSNISFNLTKTRYLWPRITADVMHICASSFYYSRANMFLRMKSEWWQDKGEKNTCIYRFSVTSRPWRHGSSSLMKKEIN